MTTPKNRDLPFQTPKTIGDLFTLFPGLNVTENVDLSYYVPKNFSDVLDVLPHLRDPKNHALRSKIYKAMEFEDGTGSTVAVKDPEGRTVDTDPLSCEDAVRRFVPLNAQQEILENPAQIQERLRAYVARHPLRIDPKDLAVNPLHASLSRFSLFTIKHRKAFSSPESLAFNVTSFAGIYRNRRTLDLVVAFKRTQEDLAHPTKKRSVPELTFVRFVDLRQDWAALLIAQTLGKDSHVIQKNRLHLENALYRLNAAICRIATFGHAHFFPSTEEAPQRYFVKTPSPHRTHTPLS